MLQCDRLPGLPPGIAALLQSQVTGKAGMRFAHPLGVVQFPRQVQDMHQRGFLGLGGVQAVYKSFFEGGMLYKCRLLFR